MKPIKTIIVMNGDMEVPYEIYRCECCDKEIEEAWPLYENNDGIYCGECAFKLGLISEQEYIHDFCYSFPCERVAVHNGKVYHAVNKKDKFFWEKNKKELRHSKRYIDWRTKVFTRDNFTCAICGQVGGTLNAHHIKPFSKYPKDRFKINNGITLCEACHKEVHRTKNEAYLYQERG